MNTNHHIDTDSQLRPRKGKVLAGIVLLAVGASLLLKQFDFFLFPHWLFSFPMLLIVCGVYLGANNSSRNNIWLLLVAFGSILLLGDIFPDFDSGAVVGPFMLIAGGIWLILRRNNKINYWDKTSWKKKWEESKYDFNFQQSGSTEKPVADFETSSDANTGSTQSQPYYSGDEHLDAVAIFGSVKKTIYSKNFQGGEIVNVFGGAEIDLTQADIKGRVVIDITQIFGGVKMIVPSHWTVVSDVAAIFAGFDDKRVKTTAPLDANKILVLSGTSIFAGVDIRSY